MSEPTNDELHQEIRLLWRAVDQIQEALLTVHPNADINVTIPSEPASTPPSEDEMRARLDEIQKELGQ
jgi:hypothetical protein